MSILKLNHSQRNQDVYVGEESGVCQYVSNRYLRWGFRNFLHLIIGVDIGDIVGHSFARKIDLVWSR